MNPIILPGRQHLEDGSANPAWLQAKCGVISGTRFASVMAKPDTAAYQNLIADLATERVYGVDEEEERFVSKAMQHGIDTEQEAFNWYSFGSDATCTKAMFVIHGDYPFIGVSPDLLVGDVGMSQIKCPQRRAQIDLICTRKLPSQYKWQVVGEMWVCARMWSDFVGYHKTLGGEVLRVERDDVEIARLKAACMIVNAEADKIAQTLRIRKERTQ